MLGCPGMGLSLFQSTPPRGGRQHLQANRERNPEFQSTPPRGGRPSDGTVTYTLIVVSIHAPARGATRRRPWVARPEHCFNPRPRAGGDALSSTSSAPARSFNPRPRAGGDPPAAAAWPQKDVSIHAPARGATWGASAAASPWRFQSTPPRGGRPTISRSPMPPVWLFQSTPPRGGRHRAHQPPEHTERVSIHAPARGATIPANGSRPSADGFNPRPRAGGDASSPPPCT